MREKLVQVYRLYAHVFCIGLATILVFMGAVEDILFFKSGHSSLLQFFTGVAGLCSLPLFLLALLIWKFRFLSFEKLIKACAHILLSLLLVGFYLYLMDYLFKNFGKSSESFYRQYFVYFFTAGALGCALLPFVLPDIEATRKNLNMLALWLTPIGISAYLGAFIYSHWPAGGPHKHAVLVIVDRLSTKYLSAYNPQAAPTLGYDEIARDSIRFTQMHTNRAYTHGFFRIFYSGRKSAGARYHTVLSALEKNGVMFKWIGSHGNGLPDTHSVKYSGLRALLINQYTFWLPTILGIPFHTYWYDGRFSKGRAIKTREEWWTDRIAALGRQNQAFFDEIGIQGIERARSFNRPTFVILYIDESGGESPSPPWCNDDSESCQIEKHIDRRAYAYTPEEEKWVKEQEAKYVDRVQLVSDSLGRFYKRFKEMGWDKDTLLMISADHGSIYDRGRIWYTYHADEEVARVPFLLNYEGRKGVDDRLFESIDIAQSLVDYFGIETRFSNEAVSFLSDQKKTYVTTLTKETNVRQEFWLNVYEGQYKFKFNIFDSSQPKLEEVSVRNPTDATGYTAFPSTVKPAFDISKVIASYGCDDGC